MDQGGRLNSGWAESNTTGTSSEERLRHRYHFFFFLIHILTFNKKISRNMRKLPLWTWLWKRNKFIFRFKFKTFEIKQKTRIPEEKPIWHRSQQLEWYIYKSRNTTGHPLSPEARKQAWDTFSHKASRRNQHLDFRLLSTCKRIRCLSHPLCGTSCGSPRKLIQDPNPGSKESRKGYGVISAAFIATRHTNGLFGRLKMATIWGVGSLSIPLKSGQVLWAKKMAQVPISRPRIF